MPASTKLLIGALGAVTPLAINLLVVDQLALSSPTALTVLGYAIRVAALVCLGVFVVVRNLDEDRPARIFQLGLAGPALITALLNGMNQRSLIQSQSLASPTSHVFLSMPVAYAAPASQPRQFELPQQTSGEQIWRGLTGARSDRVWFVIASRAPTREAAEAASDRINRTIYGFRAEVFEPYRGRGDWCVVIGEGLTHADALRLKEQARGAGLTDTEIWTPPPAVAK
jgi:hypothetical protein